MSQLCTEVKGDLNVTNKNLEWVSNDRAIIRFPDMDDVNVKKDKLIVLIYKWLED
jgi:hypothetical protein